MKQHEAKKILVVEDQKEKRRENAMRRLIQYAIHASRSFSSGRPSLKPAVSYAPSFTGRIAYKSKVYCVRFKNGEAVAEGFRNKRTAKAERNRLNGGPEEAPSGARRCS